MASNKAKKKQRAAKARNEAKKIVAAIEAKAEAPVKKKNINELDEAQLGPPGKYIDARLAQVGQQLVNWSRTDVVAFTGQVRRSPGSVNINDGVPGCEFEYMFEMWNSQGHKCDPMGFKPYYPLRDDPADVLRIMERYNYKKTLLERRTGTKITREPKLDENGQPVPKRESKPRGELDPRTGCTPGSDGHSFGEVMLSTPPGPSHRKASIEAIAKLLSTRLESSKAKSLAASWYSTLLRKRPEIYGKLRGEAAV